MKKKYLLKFLSLSLCISITSTASAISAGAAVPVEVSDSETAYIAEETPQLWIYDSPEVIEENDSAQDILSSETEPSITIKTPSPDETTIAEGRSFYVCGTLEGLTAETAKTGRMVIEVKNSDGQVIKTVTSPKYKPDLKVDPANGLPSFYDDSLDIANDSKMPDLVWDGANEASFDDPGIKCYFDETEFTALVSCKTPDWVNDQMSWNQNTEAIPASEKPYSVTATFYYTLQGDTVEKSVSSDISISIGSVSDKIMSRFSPDSHAARLTEFASEHNYRIYNDAFPGYWSKGELFCEIKPQFRAADAVEYSTGKVHFVIYNVKNSSTTYSVELAAMQKLHSIEDPNRLVNYYYEYGEPELKDKTASNITAFESGDKLELTRTEILTDGTADNVYNQDSPMPETDLNLEDGVSVKAGDTLAVYGVTAPIQIDDSDIVSNGDNSWTLNNKIAKLHYDITGNGVDVDLEKEVMLNRESDGWTNPSELEFKSNIPIEESYAGKKLTVSVTGYDIHGTKIAGTEESFQVNVASNAVKPGTVKNVKTSSAVNAITLSWAKASNAKKYQVYRYNSAKKAYAKVGETTKTSYTDKKLTAATMYQYKIRAVSKTSTAGKYSSVTKVLTKPTVPANASIKRIGCKTASTKAQLAFTVSKKATGYYVYQYQPKNKTYKVAYKIIGKTVYSYNRTSKKYTKIGTAKIKNGKLYATLTKINMKKYNTQAFKLRAYKTQSGCQKQLSSMGKKIVLK